MEEKLMPPTNPMTSQPSGWHEFCGMWICGWCEIALDAPAEHVCRPGPASVPSGWLPQPCIHPQLQLKFVGAERLYKCLQCGENFSTNLTPYKIEVKYGTK
jgi:hypothetical protein